MGRTHISGPGINLLLKRGASLGDIHTLNLRDHIMLPLVRDQFELSPKALHAGIKELHLQTVEALRQKGMDYAKLRTALTPSSDKHEAGFLFDSAAAASFSYGREAMHCVLPVLNRDSNHSVLHGDLLGNDQKLIFQILQESIVLTRTFALRHSSQLFCVYLNNLSDSALLKIHQALASSKAYVGYVPATFATRAKIYLSTTLGGAFLKHGSRIILPHEDDRSDKENVNLTSYSFEDYGYKTISLNGMNYSLFLNFKLERPIFDLNEDDASFSVNAMSDMIIPLNECDILLDEAKHMYLKSNKIGKLQKAGISTLERDGLAKLIKSKIMSNYIYNICYREEFNLIKFNVMLEVPHPSGGYPTRLTVALEYLPQNKLLRVLTLF